MAVSVYDDAFLSADDKKRLQGFTDEYNRAKEAGDSAGMAAAHNAAEAVRAGYNYSGGGNGAGYTALGNGNESLSVSVQNGPEMPIYTPATFTGYQAQTGAVNNTYDAARELALAQMKSAYDQNTATLEAERAKIPETYNAAANATAAQSEIDRQRFNEMAAASGLNSGAGSQAELSRMNALQGNLSGIRLAESQAQRDLDNQLAQLKVSYQNGIAEAIANNDYQRAAALMEEYRAAEQSRVNTERDNADEAYRGYTSRAAAAENAQSRMDLQYNRSAAGADLRAENGDYSGYVALGVMSPEEAAQAEQFWNMQNPLLALNMGRITDSEYRRIVENSLISQQMAGALGGTGTSGSRRSSGGTAGTTGGFTDTAGAGTPGALPAGNPGLLSDFEGSYLQSLVDQGYINDRDDQVALTMNNVLEGTDPGEKVYVSPERWNVLRRQYTEEELQDMGIYQSRIVDPGDAKVGGPVKTRETR